MTKFILHKTNSYYTEECNRFMAIAISHYPGVEVTAEDADTLYVTANDDATAFINFLNECDMVFVERRIDLCGK